MTRLVAQRLVRPIIAFAQEAQDLDAEGLAPLNAAAESRADELGMLARTMGNLVERLRELAGRERLAAPS